MDEEYLSRGLSKMAEINPDDQFRERMKNTHPEIAHPEIAKYTIGFAYGEMYSRLGLDSRSRQIATISALTALGFTRKELKIHIKNALNVGCTRDELVEILLHLTIHCGFTAIN
jgi:4-carboxymuconolactone decarboxylase